MKCGTPLPRAVRPRVIARTSSSLGGFLGPALSLAASGKMIMLSGDHCADLPGCC